MARPDGPATRPDTRLVVAAAVGLVCLGLGAELRGDRGESASGEHRSGQQSGQYLLIDIPDRPHAAEAPPEGWCGENTIQQALLHHGGYVSQRAINRAGEPRHPDLYWGDLPKAMRAVGLTFETWSGSSRVSDRPQRYDDFVAWLESHLRQGHPLITGVKLHPTQHPRWGLDHIVLVVGSERDAGGHLGLDINTTWRSRVRRTRAELTSRQGMSLHNRHGTFHAFAVTGLRRSGQPVRVTIRRESAETIEATVSIEELRIGQKYRLERHELGARRPVSTSEFIADATTHAVEVAIDPAGSAIWRCHPVTD